MTQDEADIFPTVKICEGFRDLRARGAQGGSRTHQRMLDHDGPYLST